MVKVKVKSDKQNRTSVYIPSFLREKFNLINGEDVDVDTDGGKIIITPIKA